MPLEISIIVPVYNRPGEMSELLQSLAAQSNKQFEVVVVEDGSWDLSDIVIKKYEDTLNIQYFKKENTGPGASRNYGCKRANGNYFLFVDSDCILPENYVEMVKLSLQNNYLDCFGGPDTYHESFSSLQKAVNYSMTSFWTTGGIRGGNITSEKFDPRSFNMGFSKAVFEQIGGFPMAQFSRSKAAGEDIELSLNIKIAGFKVGLISEALVYHKRRTSWSAFAKQTYGFGYARVTLSQRNNGALKLVHLLPLGFLLYLLTLPITYFLLGIIVFAPIVIFISLIFIDSFFQFFSLNTSFKAVLASFVQLLGYGAGLGKGLLDLFLMGKIKFLGQYT